MIFLKNDYLVIKTKKDKIYKQFGRTLRYQSKSILTILLLIFAFETVNASPFKPDRVYISMASKHVNLTPDPGTEYNEINPGLILSWNNRKYGLDYWSGVFQNSFSSISPFAAAAKMWPLGSDIKLGVFGSIAGYYSNGSISTKIGNSGYVFLGGFQFEYRNIFIQIQPTLINNKELGGVFITGVSLPLK